MALAKHLVSRADLAAFVWVAKAQAAQQSGRGGLIGAPERALQVTKGAVTAGRTTDPQWAGALADWGVMGGAFITSLRGRSIFVSLIEDDLGMTRAPMRAHVASVTRARLVAGAKQIDASTKLAQGMWERLVSAPGPVATNGSARA